MSIRDLSVRKFRTENARTVARIINSNLLDVNNNENQEEVAPKLVLTLSNKRKMFVAVNDDGKIVGTASIDHDTIYTVFVDVDYHNQGVEEALLNLLEEITANNGFGLIKLVARINTQKLFEKLGYNIQGEAAADEFGESVIMEKYLF
jgi:ribosomal protein S18 acetylase RimI-like enzyme